MAGPETVHKVVEELEVRNGDAAVAAFDRLAEAAENAAGAMNWASVQSDGVTRALKEQLRVQEEYDKKASKPRKKPKEEGPAPPPKTGFAKIAEAATGAFGKFRESMAFDVLVGNYVTKVLEGITTAFIAVGKAAYQTNVILEQTRNRVQGMTLGLVDLRDAGHQAAVALAGGAGPTREFAGAYDRIAKTQDGVARLALAQKAANVVLGQFRDIAYETATPIETIEGAYRTINPVLSGLGKSQLEVLRLTRLSAAAAKVYGEDATQAGQIAAKAIFSGVVEGEGALARAIKAQAQVTSTMSVEERMKRVQGVLTQMAGPIDVVAQGTESAVARWDQLSNQILARVTEPMFRLIGDVVNGIVGYMKENEAAIMSVVDDTAEWLDTFINTGKAVWDVVVGLGEAIVWVLALEDALSLVWQTLNVVEEVVDFIVTAWRGLVQGIRVLAGDDQGFGKLLAYSKAIEIKFREIALQALKMVRAFDDLITPDWLKTDGADPLPGVTKLEKSLQEDVDKMVKHLRRLEQQEGMAPLTDASRKLTELETGKTLKGKAAEDFLASLKGLKINQTIGTVEIHQDLRGEDPDTILLEFVTGLERLGENALQSNVAGRTTAFETGSSY